MVLFFKKELLPFFLSHPLLASLGLGALTALALPPFNIVPVIFLTIPALLSLIGGAPAWRGAGLRGLAFGWALSMTGLYWVTNAVLVMAAQFWWAVPITVPLLSLVLALFIAVPCAAARMVPAGWRRPTGCPSTPAACWPATAASCGSAPSSPTR